MIAGSLLLLVGVVSPFEGDVPEIARPAATPTPMPVAPVLIERGKRRPAAAVRRPQRNDNTETLRALNMMRVGFGPAPEQNPVQNR